MAIQIRALLTVLLIAGCAAQPAHPPLSPAMIESQLGPGSGPTSTQPQPDGGILYEYVMPHRTILSARFANNGACVAVLQIAQQNGGTAAAPTAEFNPDDSALFKTIAAECRRP